MMKRAAVLCALLALAGVGSVAAQNKPITKVVTLMKDMIKQLQTEAEGDQEAYEALGCWCETNDKEKTKAIADGKQRILSLNADIEKFTSGAKELSEGIAALEAEIAKNQAALDSATALRNKQLAEFTEEEKDMMTSIGSLGSAVTTLSKHHEGALLQLSDSEEIDLKTMIRSLLRKHRDLLQEVISPRQQRAVEAFAQLPSGYMDGFVQQASPGAGPASYTPASGQIFGVLKQMKETFEGNLAKSQEEEALNQQSYEDMKEAKESELKAGTTQSSQKSALLAETEEKNAQAKRDLEETTLTLEADTKYLANLKEHCANIDKEYEERTSTRNAEMQAVSKAMAFLTSDEAHDLFDKTLGFVQLTSQKSKRAMVAEKLHQVARKTHDPRLSTLAARVRLDAFGKVKESLQSMIDNLLKEKEDEIKHKDFCIDSLNQNLRTTETKTREKADAEAKIADHINAIDTMVAAIKADEQDILTLRTALKKLGEDRTKANKEFQEVVADQRATAKLLTAALDMLGSFYKKSALLQAKAKAAVGGKQPAGPPPPPGFKTYSNNAASGGVMNMIQSIIDDAKAMEKEALEAEAQAQQAYEDTVADTNAAVKAKQEDIVQKTEVKAREEEGKVEQEATRDEKVADIEQLQKENLDLHYDCDYALKNFDLRMTARDAEVEALKQGLATFSGATFTSLLEKGA